MKYLIPPWKHQLEAIDRAKDMDFFALLFEMGAGKTSTAINIMRHKFQANGGLMRTLILCPPIVVENWKREFGLHSKIDSKQITLLQGPGKKRIQLFNKHAWLGDPFDFKTRIAIPHIFITNYEGLLMGELFDSLQAWGPEVMVVDESHKCKDQKSKRTKAVTALSDKAKYVYILSGSPVLNSPMDLFSQFKIMDKGQALGKNFFAFRARYFYDKNAGMPKAKYFPDFRIKPGALDELNRIIHLNGSRVTKAECMDLPPIVRQVIEVEMVPEQRRAYETMKKDLIAFIKDSACVAQLAIVKALRLMQITSGHLPVENLEGEKTVHRLKDNPKKDALKELLSEICTHSKVLVWAVFKENYHDIRSVCEELKLEYVEVHGEVSNKQEAVDRFNSDPSVRVFIGHPVSGGIGINLVSASFSIFYSRNFSLENDLQAEARNHRGGQTQSVTRIDLVCKDTIDAVVLERLAQKQEVSEAVLSDLAAAL